MKLGQPEKYVPPMALQPWLIQLWYHQPIIRRLKECVVVRTLIAGVSTAFIVHPINGRREYVYRASDSVGVGIINRGRDKRGKVRITLMNHRGSRRTVEHHRNGFLGGVKLGVP